MAFTLITPPAKVKSGTFKISSVCFGKSGAWRLQITIPSIEYTKAFGAGEALDVLKGDGQDTGKLLLRANPDGLFKPAGLKNCFVLRLPADGTAPEIDLACEDPERRSNGAGQLVIDLPEWAWQPGRWQEIQKARNIAGRQNAAEEKITRKDALARIGQIK
jgi:hypothetical protein